MSHEPMRILPGICAPTLQLGRAGSGGEVCRAKAERLKAHSRGSACAHPRRAPLGAPGKGKRPKQHRHGCAVAMRGTSRKRAAPW